MKGRILIVDSDVGVTSTLEFHLHAAEFVTETAGTEPAAIRAIHGFKPGIVLADAGFEGLAPLRLLSTIRGAGLPIDVVILSARRSMKEAVQVIQSGAYDYLSKPVDLAHLDSTLARCLRDRRARQQAGTAPELDPNPLVGSSPHMVRIYKTIARVAPTDTAVLIRGETGTGKELVARSIHEHSSRAGHPFIAVNCTAVPETLLESELFGHVKGAFTGAATDRRGRFETTGEGTLFLDEIGDTSPAFQAKLLRVLQDGEFYPVGSETPRRSRARVLAATHHDVEDLVRRGEFRQDLYFRLRVVEIFVPPLRERAEDIPRLARHFLAKAARIVERSVRVIPADAMRRLEEHDWPGNVRELENAITRAAVLARGPVLHADDLGLELPAAPTTGDAASDQRLSVLSMDDAERRQVEQVLEKTEWNKRQAARTLRISRGRLDRLIKKHGLDGEEAG